MEYKPQVLLKPRGVSQNNNTQLQFGTKLRLSELFLGSFIDSQLIDM